MLPLKPKYYPHPPTHLPAVSFPPEGAIWSKRCGHYSTFYNNPVVATLVVSIANIGLYVYMHSLHYCLQYRPAWTYAISAPIFSTPAIHSRTSSIFVAAVTGSLTALSYTGHPLWQRTLGSQVFAPLCCLPASSSAAVERQQLLGGSNHVAEPYSAADQPLQASMTNWEADAAAAPHAAAAAATATAATGESKGKHTLACVGAVGCGAAVDPDGGARGRDGDMVLIGTSSGTLHFVSCSSGQQLWQIQTGGSISTAAGFCPAGRAHALSDAPAAANTDGLADLLSHKSAAAHEQTQTEAQTDSKADAQAQCPLQHQQQSFHRQQTGVSTQMEMTFVHLLVSCTNSGAVNVLTLPAATGPVVSLDHEVLQSGQGPNEEVQQSPIPCTWAAAQMPGERMFC